MSYNVEKYGRNFQMVGLSKLQNLNSVKSWASEAILKLKYSVDWLIKFRQVQVVHYLRWDGVPQAGETLLDVVASLALKRIVVGALVRMTARPAASTGINVFVMYFNIRRYRGYKGTYRKAYIVSVLQSGSFSKWHSIHEIYSTLYSCECT